MLVHKFNLLSEVLFQECLINFMLLIQLTQLELKLEWTSSGQWYSE